MGDTHIDISHFLIYNRKDFFMQLHILWMSGGYCWEADWELVKVKEGLCGLVYVALLEAQGFLLGKLVGDWK